MNATEAIEKMGSLLPADPRRYLLSLVAGAIAGGATRVEVVASKAECGLDFDGTIYSRDELKELFANALDGSDPALRHLAVGLHAAGNSEGARVMVETWDGKEGGRLRLGDGKQRTEQIAKVPWRDGVARNRIRIQLAKDWRETVGLGQVPFKGIFGGTEQEPLPDEAELVRQECRHAPVTIEINGTAVNEPVDLGPCTVWVHLEADEKVPGSELPVAPPQALGERRDSSGGRFSAVLALGGDEEPAFTAVVHGVSFPVEVPILEELGVRGVVAAPELTLVDDQSAVQEDDALDGLLGELEEHVMQMGAQLAQQFGRVPEQERAQVGERVHHLVELYRSTEAFEEAQHLLELLLDGQRATLDENDAEIAESVTALARLQEAQGKWDDCYPTYQEAVALWDAQEEPDETSLAICLNGLGQLAYSAGEFERAEELAQRALEIRRRTHDAEDLELGTSYELLARVYVTLYAYPARKYMEVEELYREALRIFEANFGHHHADVATILHDMAEYYRAQRRYEEAEPCYVRALAIREKILGPQDPLVADTLETLGSLYEDQGKSTKAGKYYLKALEIWDRILGPEHPDVAQRLNNLVVLYRVYGKYSDAEPLYRRILEIREKALGADHVDLTPDLCSLALLYQVQGKFNQAEPLFERARLILATALGEDTDHPEMAWVLNLLGELYDEQYRFAQAEEQLHRALAIWEKVLGNDHPDVAVSLEYLIRHYRTQQKYAEAEPHARRVVALCEMAFGVHHPETITALNTLGELMRLQGLVEESRPYFVKAYELRVRQSDSIETANGAEVDNIEHSRYTAARLEANQLHREAVAPAREFSRYPEAEHLYLRALFTREQVLGPRHPNNARTLDKLAELYRTHHKFEGAEQLHLRSLDLRRRSLGREHPDTCVSLRNLVETYLMQSKFNEAEEHAVQWLAIAESTLGPEHVDVAMALTRLARIYEHQGKAEQVDESLKRAMDIRHQALGVEHPDFATALAELLRVRGNYDEAARLYGFVVTSLEEVLGHEAIELVPVFENYATVLSKLGKEDEAATYETQAMVIKVQHGLDFM